MKTTGYLLAPASRANAMVAGPQGAIWFSGRRGVGEPEQLPYGIVGRITPHGKVTEFSSGAEEGLTGIAVGADGALWVGGANKIFRVTTTGQFTPFALPVTESQPRAIVAGPEGALWFTAGPPDQVGRITTAGLITEFPLPTGSEAGQIVVGSDGNLWVAAPGTDSIDRVTTAGDVTAFPIGGGAKNQPVDLALGPDGNVFFTQKVARIGRISPTGEIVEFRIEHPAGVITSGPDGDVWFSAPMSLRPENFDVNGIASITAEGHPTYPVCVGECAFPISALSPGPTGTLWYGKQTAIVLGGGASHQEAEIEDGHVGEFVPPPVRLRLPRALRARGSATRLRIQCRGGVAGESCRGRLTLSASPSGGHRFRLGTVRFDLLSGEERALALHLTGQARRLLKRKVQLPVRASGSLPLSRKELELSS